jgi:hypothetical protein
MSSVSAIPPGGVVYVNGMPYAPLQPSGNGLRVVTPEQSKPEKKQPSMLRQVVQGAGALAVGHFGTKWVSENTDWILKFFGPNHQKTGRVVLEALTSLMAMAV